MQRLTYEGQTFTFADDVSPDDVLALMRGESGTEQSGVIGEGVKRLARGALQIPLQVPRFVGAVGDLIRSKVGDEQGRVFGDIGTEPGSAFTSSTAVADKWIDDNLPRTREGFGYDVLEGVGQFAPTVGTGLAVSAVTKGVAKGAAAAAGAATMGFFAETMDAYDRELARQASVGEPRNPDRAFAKALGYGTLSAAIEGQFGAGRIARQLTPKAIAEFTKRGVSKNALAQFAGKVTKETAIGAGQESSQRAIQDLIVEGKIDPSAVGYEGAVGGVVQGLFRVPSAMMERGRGIQVDTTAERELTEDDELTSTPAPTVEPTGIVEGGGTGGMIPVVRQETEITPELAAQMALDPRLSGTPARQSEVARLGVRRGVAEFQEPLIQDAQGNWIPRGQAIEQRETQDRTGGRVSFTQTAEEMATQVPERTQRAMEAEKLADAARAAAPLLPMATAATEASVAAAEESAPMARVTPTATPVESLPPPGPTSPVAVTAAVPESQAVTPTPPAVETVVGTLPAESQVIVTGEKGAPNAIQESGKRTEAVSEPVGTPVQQEAGAGVLRDAGLEQAGEAKAQADVTLKGREIVTFAVEQGHEYRDRPDLDVQRVRTVSDLFNSPSLFSEFPGLAKTKVRWVTGKSHFEPVTPSSHGNVITVPLNVPLRVKLDTIGHELWHRMQRVRGVENTIPHDFTKSGVFGNTDPAYKNHPEEVAARAFGKRFSDTLLSDIESIHRSIGPHEIWNEPLRSWKESTRLPDDLHEKAVRNAVNEGKPVPAEVLADYPDLQRKESNEKEVQKEETVAKPTEGIHAEDTVGDTSYQYRIVKRDDSFVIEARISRPDGTFSEWESGGWGGGRSRYNAAYRFVERYPEATFHDADFVKAKQEYDEITAKRLADESAKKAASDAAQQLRSDYYAEVDATELPKATKGTVTLKSGEGSPAQSVEATLYGDIAVHQTGDTRGPFKYRVTHVPTGLGFGNDLKISTLGQAKRFVKGLIHSRVDLSKTEFSNDELSRLSEVKRALFAEDRISYTGAGGAKVVTPADTSPPKWFRQPAPRTNTDILNTAAQVKIKGPEGATQIRVTDANGKKAVAPINSASKGANAFRGAGPFTSVEFGTINRKGEFQPMAGEGTVTEKTLADRIRDKKVKDPNLYDATLGIPIAAWNGLLEAIATLVETGATIRAAIATVVSQYKEANPGVKFDEKRVAAELERQATPITKVPGERMTAKRVLASPDIPVGIKERISNRLYQVVSAKEAEALAAEIMAASPNLDAAINLANQHTEKVPAFVQGALAGAIVAEATRQEQAATAAGDTARAEELQQKAADFLDRFFSRVTDSAQLLALLKPLYKMTPQGLKVWAVRATMKAAGVDMATWQPMMDEIRKQFQGADAGARNDVVRNNDIKERLWKVVEAWVSEDAAVKELAKQMGVSDAALKERIAKARKAHQAKRPVNPKADSLDKLIRARIGVSAQKVGQAVDAAKKKEGNLGANVAAELGLQGKDAEDLAKLINDKQAALKKARRMAALNRVISSKPGKIPVKIERIAKLLVEAEDLGMMSDAEFQAKLDQMFAPRKLTPEKLKEFERLAKEVLAVPEDQENLRHRKMQALMNSIADVTDNWWDLPMSVWYANMLSGLTTQFLNVSSTAANGLGEWMTQLRNPAGFLASTKAILQSIPAALRESAHTLRTGEVAAARLTKIGAARYLERVGGKGWQRLFEPLKYIGRFMAASDLFFFVPLKNMREVMLVRGEMKRNGLSGSQATERAMEHVLGTDASRARAYQQALSEGYTGIEAKRRQAEIVQSSVDAAIREQGKMFGERATFNQQNGYGIMGAIVRAVNHFSREIPANKLVVPFVNVVGNVVNEGLNYSPIGTARAAWAWTKYRYLNKQGKPMQLYGEAATNEDLADLYAKSIGATILLGVLAHVAAGALDADGNDDPEKDWAIFGFGPRDPGKRDTWRSEGKIPFSVRVGGRYYSFANTPLGIPLAILGNYFDALRYKELGQEDALARAHYALRQFHHVILQQSFLDGVAKLLDVKDNVSPRTSIDQTLRTAGRTVATFVIPNIVRQVDTIFDPSVYKPADVEGMLLQSVPFARRTGKPAVNGLGEEISFPLAARWTREQSSDPVWRELGRLNVAVYPSRMEYQGTQLDHKQLAHVAEISGPKIRQIILRTITSPNYDKLPDREGRLTKQDVLSRHIERIRSAAKTQVMRGHPRAE